MSHVENVTHVVGHGSRAGIYLRGILLVEKRFVIVAPGVDGDAVAVLSWLRFFV